MGAILDQQNGTILNGATVSSVVYLGDKVPVSLQIPAAFSSTAMSFQASWDGVTYQQVNTGSGVYSVGVAAGKNVAVDGSQFQGFRFLKLVAGTAEGADRVVGVNIRRDR